MVHAKKKIKSNVFFIVLLAIFQDQILCMSTSEKFKIAHSSLQKHDLSKWRPSISHSKTPCLGVTNIYMFFHVFVSFKYTKTIFHSLLLRLLLSDLCANPSSTFNTLCTHHVNLIIHKQNRKCSFANNFTDYKGNMGINYWF